MSYAERRDECLTEMEEWLSGERSETNTFVGLTGDRAHELAMSQVADAHHVMALAAAAMTYGMLAKHEATAYGPLVDGRSFGPRNDEAAWKEATADPAFRKDMAAMDPGLKPPKRKRRTKAQMEATRKPPPRLVRDHEPLPPEEIVPGIVIRDGGGDRQAPLRPPQESLRGPCLSVVLGGGEQLCQYCEGWASQGMPCTECDKGVIRVVQR